jgi:hypothetical protein
MPLFRNRRILLLDNVGMTDADAGTGVTGTDTGTGTADGTGGAREKEDIGGSRSTVSTSPAPFS